MVKGKGGERFLNAVRKHDARRSACAANIRQGRRFALCRPVRARSAVVNRHLVWLGLSMALAARAAADDGCPNELKMFERDVRVAREMRERVIWQLAGFNYQRRVSRYCAAEERRSAVNRLKLTDDELKLLGVARD